MYLTAPPSLARQARSAATRLAAFPSYAGGLVLDSVPMLDVAAVLRMAVMCGRACAHRAGDALASEPMLAPIAGAVLDNSTADALPAVR